MPEISLLKKSSKFKKLFQKSASFLTKKAWSFLPRSCYLTKSIQQLNLALTRMCNINCVFCPYQFAGKHEQIHMPDNIFEKISSEIKDADIKEVCISPNIGEPLLAPALIEKIITLRKCGVSSINLTTNATCLHKIGIEAFLKDGPDGIYISFPGFDKEMYEKICRRPFYEQTRTNILSILHMNASLEKPRIINIGLRGNISFEKMMAFPEMEEVCELADNVSIITEVDNWIGQIKQEILPEGLSIQKDVPPLTKRPCTKLFSLTIHPDGDIHLCSCRNIFNDPTLHIGNTEELTLTEAYSKIPDILNSWEAGNLPLICKSCSMYCEPADAILGSLRRQIFTKSQP